MVNNNKISQITNTHKLVKFVEQLKCLPNKRDYLSITIDYFFDNIIRQLEMNFNFIITTRQNIIAKKVKLQTGKLAKIDLFLALLNDKFFLDIVINILILMK